MREDTSMKKHAKCLRDTSREDLLRALHRIWEWNGILREDGEETWSKGTTLCYLKLQLITMVMETHGRLVDKRAQS